MIDRLKGGVNIERDQIGVLAERDLDYMHASGVRALRIFLWPKNYLSAGKPMNPAQNPDVQAVAGFITKAVARDLAVIVVPFGGSGYRPVDDPETIAMQVGWMEEFAEYAAFHWDPHWVLIETWNEPLMDSADSWREIEGKLIAAVRRKAPDFTVVATPLRWSSRDAMLEMVPHKDKKVIYDLHYYIPMDYTHQGLPWMDEHFKNLCNLPYPGFQGYNADRIMADFDSVADWAKTNHVKVVVGEFGVGDQCTTPLDKAAYLHDVRAAAAKHGMGWIVWEYNKAFSIAEKDEADQFRIKAEYLEALGWKGASPK